MIFSHVKISYFHYSDELLTVTGIKESHEYPRNFKGVSQMSVTQL